MLWIELSLCLKVCVLMWKRKILVSQKVIINVETKRCTVKLVRLDSILFGDTSDNSACASEDDNANLQKMLQTPPNLPRLRPKEQIKQKQSNQMT